MRLFRDAVKNGSNRVPGEQLEPGLIQRLPRYLGFLRDVGAAFPVLAAVSLVGAKGWGMLPPAHVNAPGAVLLSETLKLPTVEVTQIGT
jgi:hypothetical protein